MAGFLNRIAGRATSGSDARLLSRVETYVGLCAEKTGDLHADVDRFTRSLGPWGHNRFQALTFEAMDYVAAHRGEQGREQDETLILGDGPSLRPAEFFLRLIVIARERLAMRP